ncbi:serine O-acetyltransferase [Paenibacillus silvisoli]|uniref:serine O-acetyltransferase n=1 Tax=Paenibacillus silvisoli TaxID=3110539 RepID=UPI0028048D65|nr:serine acetyltransferase [Paenibacillus silvisoli]
MAIIKDVIEEVNRGQKGSFISSILKIYMSPGKHALFLLRIAQYLHGKGYKFIPTMIKNRLVRLYGVHISLTAKIDIGVDFRHINGIVIGDGVVIGKNSIIYQQVTLGGQNLGDGIKGNYPMIGDNVTIFAGAKILGNVTIGDGSIIGANSVVIKDVPSNAVVAGVPARVIKVINV